MPRQSLTGSRIRERRMVAGLRQADLARRVGISASYLNLIEHNRRRIGGKLLVDLALVLGVEPSMLTEGAEATLVTTLREAAAAVQVPVAELDRAEEFAGRFPGWAEVLAAHQRRIAALERTVQTLSDQLTHDPHLAASLHEVLSTAASIRSTAGILVDTTELEPEWRNRFHRNLNEDSLRLAESTRALVDFLDQSEKQEEKQGLPQDEVDQFLEANAYHFPQLEDEAITAAELVQGAPELESRAAVEIASRILAQYQDDMKALPLKTLSLALAEEGMNADRIARRFDCDLPVVLRRLAFLPADLTGRETGFVMCDASGAILLRKPVTGFVIPQFGSSCPLWPLYAALTQPQIPVLRQIRQDGRNTLNFDCFALSWPVSAARFGADPQYCAAMLLVPSDTADTEAPSVGANCRICMRADCSARRMPSILREEF